MDQAARRRGRFPVRLLAGGPQGRLHPANPVRRAQRRRAAACRLRTRRSAGGADLPWRSGSRSRSPRRGTAAHAPHALVASPSHECRTGRPPLRGYPRHLLDVRDGEPRFPAALVEAPISLSDGASRRRTALSSTSKHAPVRGGIDDRYPAEAAVRLSRSCASSYAAAGWGTSRLPIAARSV